MANTFTYTLNKGMYQQNSKITIICDGAAREFAANVRARTKPGNTSKNRIAAGGGKNPTIGIGYCIKLLAKTPEFTIGGTASDGSVYGNIQSNGSLVNWIISPDGDVIKTALTPSEVSQMGEQGLEGLAVLITAAWLQTKEEEMASIYAKALKDELTFDDLCIYSDAFYFSPLLPTTNQGTLISGLTNPECAPAKEKKPAAAQENNNVVTDPCLPWTGRKTLSYTVEEAMTGAYRMSWNPEKKVEGEGDTYKPAFLGLDILETYTDNMAYRIALRQIVRYFNNMWRTHKLENRKEVGYIDDYLASKGVEMDRSYFQNICLAGEPGTGKTSVARAIAATFGFPITIVRCSARDEKDELTETVTATTKGFTTKKSPFYWAIKYGGVVVLDDVTNADTNTLFAQIGGLLEAPYEYRCGSEMVKRNPACIIFATENVGTQGSINQNEALLNRFTHIIAEQMSGAEMQKAMHLGAMKACGYAPDDKTSRCVTKWVNNALEKCRSAVEGAEDRETALNLITLRGAISLTESIYTSIRDNCLNEEDLIEDAKAFMAGVVYSAGYPDLKEGLYAVIEGLPELRI